FKVQQEGAAIAAQILDGEVLQPGAGHALADGFGRGGLREADFDDGPAHEVHAVVKAPGEHEENAGEVDGEGEEHEEAPLADKVHINTVRNQFHSDRARGQTGVQSTVLLTIRFFPLLLGRRQILPPLPRTWARRSAVLTLFHAYLSSTL